MGIEANVLHETVRWAKAQAAMFKMVVEPPNCPEVTARLVAGHGGEIRPVGIWGDPTEPCTMLFFACGTGFHTFPGARPCSPHPALGAGIEVRISFEAGWSDPGMCPRRYAHDLRTVGVHLEGRAKPVVSARDCDEIIFPDDEGGMVRRDFSDTGADVKSEPEVLCTLDQGQIRPIYLAQQTSYLLHSLSLGLSTRTV
jgi:hypothetical protein